jgi:hypothetical protein
MFLQTGALLLEGVAVPDDRIDLYDYDKRLAAARRLLREADISERNRSLILEFEGDCASGWGGRKLGKARRLKILQRLRPIAETMRKLSLGNFDDLTERDVKRLLRCIDEEHPGAEAQRELPHLPPEVHDVAQGRIHVS